MKKTILLLVVLLSAFTACAQNEALSARDKQTIIKTLSDKLIQSYVFPDKAKMVSGKLKPATLPADKAQFAKELNETLKRLLDDVHLQVVYDEEKYRELLQPSKAEPGQKTQSHNAFNTGNYGFFRSDILPGNIGYIKITGFYEYGEAFKIAAAAMEYTSRTDAVIFDLRGNPGGSGKMGQFLASYFFREGDNRKLLENYNRADDVLVQEWTLFTIPGERRPETPVYILIDGGTGSAAEAFAYAMQANKRATIVGEKSAGGAHSGHLEPLANGFVAFIPSGRVTSPVTKSNWEGTGVKPDVTFSAKRALYKAESMILKELKDNPGIPKDEARQTIYDWYIKYADMRANKPAVIDCKERNYAGAYGQVTISVENNQVYWMGNTALQAYSETEFFLPGGYTSEGDLIIEFDDPRKPAKLRYKVLDKSGTIATIELARQ